tara:strand:- start:8242 stop:10725 length:2484 start_codon:yes stop_codon:yes gene_type:complete
MKQNSIFGILANGNPATTESQIRAALNHGFNQPIVFVRDEQHLTEQTDFTRQFGYQVAADADSAKEYLRFRYQLKDPVLFDDLNLTPSPVNIVDQVQPIRVGFILYGLTFGGISRVITNLIEAPVDHGLEWSGVAIRSVDLFDEYVGERVRRCCPIYSLTEYEPDPSQTQVVENPFQSVIDNSDVIYITGYVSPHPLFDKTDWQNKPLILSAHGQCEGSVKQIEETLKYGGKKICLAVSQAAVDRYPEQIRDQVRVVYNGTNFSRCAPVRNREDVRAEWGIDDHTKAVGYMGRMAYDKNPLAAAIAVNELKEGFHAVYIGNGYAEQEIRPAVKELCGDRCTILDKTEDIGSALNALDCLVISSPLEGGPIIASEAWLAGCPVVSTPVGMIPELEAKHGQLTHHLDTHFYSDQLIEAIKTAVYDEEVTERAKRVAWETFSPIKAVQEFERAIRDGLEVTPAPLVDQRIRVGFSIETCSMGGVSRGVIALMDQGCAGLSWSGVAIQGPGTFDPDTARSILKHCPIYAAHDHPSYQGLVTIVPNQYECLVNQSDVIKLWGAIHTRPELDQVDWNKVTVITAAHGQCDWTRQNIETSLKYGRRHLLISVSAGGIKCFPEYLRDQVHVIYNGLDFKRSMAIRGRRELREAWNVSEETALVAYIGRFAKDKNPLAAAKAVNQLGEKYHAIYVGEGVHQAEIIEGVNQLCGDRCTFEPRTEDIGSILAAVDCLVLCSPSEGCPQIMMEAFAAQCPVVSTRVGFLPEFEPEFGKLTYEVPFDPAPEQLAAAVKSAVCDSDELTQKACSVALQKFNPRKYARDFENIVRRGMVVEL